MYYYSNEQIKLLNKFSADITAIDGRLPDDPKFFEYGLDESDTVQYVQAIKADQNPDRLSEKMGFMIDAFLELHGKDQTRLANLFLAMVDDSLKASDIELLTALIKKAIINYANFFVEKGLRGDLL